MKKLVLASVMALAGICLVSSPTLRAQGSDQSGTIQIQNPAEYNAFQQAMTQTDPKAKASALEDFLKNYPQSVAKKAALDQLIDASEAANDVDGALNAASRMLQVDPNSMKAIYVSVQVKKSQCLKNNDQQVCDDAGALAQKGLSAPKPADTADADWKKMTDTLYPLFHSTIAADDSAKKDYKAAIGEYRKELMMVPLQDTARAPALVDTVYLAEAYTKPGDTKDYVQACWFYARAWNFLPAAYKAQVEPKLEYYYKRYHGNLDGLDQMKTTAQSTLFKPDNFTIAPAPTPPEIVHNVITSTPDLKTLNLEDKEFILANGTKDDAQRLWSVVQNQLTPVPGVVIDDPANVLKISVSTTAAAKPKDYVVKLATPAPCGSAPPAPAGVKAAQDYINANADKSDLAQLGDVLTTTPHKIEVEPAVNTINVAVTQDAKDNKAADFIVHLKEPVACKEAPAPGFEYKLQPAAELDATYDTFTPVPATPTRTATAQIVLREGFIQEEKKASPVHHTGKPSAGHRPTH